MTTSEQILNYLNIKHPGDPVDIKWVAPPTESGANCLIFCKYKDYLEYAKNFKDSVMLVTNVDGTKICTKTPEGNIIVSVDDPRFTFAKLVYKFMLSNLFNKPQADSLDDIRSKSKYIADSVVIYHSKIGKDCRFHENVLIGIEDFCAIDHRGERIMFPQLGSVKLGDRVEVYSNSMINRGALCVTEVDDDTKIDALCQVGHNCKIGKRCMICAGTVIAGSATVGDDTFLGIGVTVRNGIHIGNNVTVAQGSNVVKDIPDNAIVMGNPAQITGWNDPKHSPTQVP